MHLFLCHDQEPKWRILLYSFKMLVMKYWNYSKVYSNCRLIMDLRPMLEGCFYLFSSCPSSCHWKFWRYWAKWLLKTSKEGKMGHWVWCVFFNLFWFFMVCGVFILFLFALVFVSVVQILFQASRSLYLHCVKHTYRCYLYKRWWIWNMERIYFSYTQWKGCSQALFLHLKEKPFAINVPYGAD